MPSTVMLSRALAICASPKLARSFSTAEAAVTEAGTVMVIVMMTEAAATLTATRPSATPAALATTPLIRAIVAAS